MSIRPTFAESRTVVESVRLETYVALADERRGSVPRLTFDRGRMELMSPKKEHESIGRLLGRMIETFSEHHGDALTVFLLDGPSFHPSKTSRLFPGFPLPLAESVLARRHREGETGLIREFRRKISS